MERSLYGAFGEDDNTGKPPKWSLDADCMEAYLNAKRRFFETEADQCDLKIMNKLIRRVQEDEPDEKLAKVIGRLHFDPKDLEPGKPWHEGKIRWKIPQQEKAKKLKGNKEKKDMGNRILP